MGTELCCAGFWLWKEQIIDVKSYLELFRVSALGMNTIAVAIKGESIQCKWVQNPLLGWVMLVVWKENPLSLLCCWASLCCRVRRNGDVNVAFFLPPTAEFSTWSSNLGLSCVGWVCLFFSLCGLWQQRMSGERVGLLETGWMFDVGNFFYVWEEKAQNFFYQHWQLSPGQEGACDAVSGRNEES